MPADFVNALKTEISLVEDDLATDPRFRKLQCLRAALKTYEPNSGTGIRDNVPPATKQNGNKAGRKSSETRQWALELSKNHLEALDHSYPTPTKEVLEAILAQGAVIGGKDPVSNLSAMLSQSDLFKAHGRSGWTLVSKMQSDAQSKDDSSEVTPDAPETGDGIAGDAPVRDHGAFPDTGRKFSPHSRPMTDAEIAMSERHDEMPWEQSEPE